MILEFAASLKDKGNQYFREKEFKKSEELYTEAIEKIQEQEGFEAISLMCNLRVNRAACYLKIQKFSQCIADCSIVLLSDNSEYRVKALYRRAQGLAKLQKWNESRADLLLLLNLDPKNQEATLLLQEVGLELQKHIPSSEVQRALNFLVEESNVISGIRRLIDLCGDDCSHALEFGRLRGLEALGSLIHRKQHELECIKLFAVLTNHRSFVEQFIILSSISSTAVDFKTIELSVSANGTVQFFTVFGLFHTTIGEVHRAAVVLIMNILRSFPVTVSSLLSTQASPTRKFQDSDLFLPRSIGYLVISSFMHVIRLIDNKSFGFCCDAFCAFISDSPNYYDNSKPIDVRLESMDERKARLERSEVLSFRSQTHSQWAVEFGFIKLLTELLDNPDPTVRNTVSSTLGKLIKAFNSNEAMKNHLLQFLGDGLDIKNVRLRAALEASLLLTHPELGVWALEQNNGVVELLRLLTTNDDRNLEVASEVICLASNVDSNSVLKPIVELDLLKTLVSSDNLRVKSNAASAMAKLSVKSKALTQESMENSLLLGSVKSVLKSSTEDHQKQLDSLSVERCIETLAALAGKTYIKEEIVHGTKPLLKDLLKVKLPEGSAAFFGLSHIFAALTVTNRELKALALADKEMTIEQYEQLQELQRIKAKDENGGLLEERKEEREIDTQDMCNLRITKIVSLGGFPFLFSLLHCNSTQVKQNTCRALRQICVVESVRGVFLQEGGLKICCEVANDDSVEKLIRLEAAHAIAKALVTTNPNMLNEYLRLNVFRPLLFICKEVDSSQVQQFEALLALTNLLSCGESEQNLFVTEKGVSAVHYLMFSNNLMVRRAATEALCNIGAHEAMIRILRDSEKLKLWLALAEDWDRDEGSLGESFLTARAALGTLAMAGDDDGIASAMVKSDCAQTLCSLLSTAQPHIVHRALVSIMQLLGEGRIEFAHHLMEGGMISVLSQSHIVEGEFCELAKGIAKTMLEVLKKGESN